MVQSFEYLILYMYNRVQKSFQVVTYRTICTGHKQHNNHDIIIVKATMTRQNSQKLQTREITKMDVSGDILRNFRYSS